MWIWIVPVLIIIVILAFIFGLRRVRTGRSVGPEEGIEDDETVRSYDRISRWPPFKILRMLAVRELKKLNPHGLLADIGCGPGYFTKDAARALPQIDIIAVDISDEMLHRAEKNLAARGSAGEISFRQGDIHDLPLEDNSIDFIVTTLSLHHWSEPPQALLEMHRVLKPRGQFLVFDTRRDSPWIFYRLLKFAQKFILPSQLKEKNEPTSSIMASYTPEEVQEFLDGTPFSDRTIKPGFFWLFASGRKEP